MKRSNIGIYNNNWKGGRRRDELDSGEPLPERRQIELRIELYTHMLKPGVIPAGFPHLITEAEARLETAKEDLKAYEDTHQDCIDCGKTIAIHENSEWKNQIHLIRCPKCALQLGAGKNQFEANYVD